MAYFAPVTPQLTWIRDRAGPANDPLWAGAGGTRWHAGIIAVFRQLFENMFGILIETVTNLLDAK